MSMIGIGFMEMLIVLFMGAGIGIPLGVPPAPEDPWLWQIAPEQCLFYTTWSGTVEPDRACPNRTEQLLAEPEVRQLLAEVRRVVDLVVDKAASDAPERVRPALLSLPLLGQTLLSSPTALYVETLEIGSRGPLPSGALIVKLGRQNAKFRAAIQALAAQVPSDQIQTFSINGLKFSRTQPSPQAPLISWGFKDDYFLVGLGDDAIERLLERAATPPPQWLSQLGERMSVPRRATFTYLNLSQLVTLATAAGGPMAEQLVQAFGVSALDTHVTVSGLDETRFVVRSLLRTRGKPIGIADWLAGRPLDLADLRPIPRTAQIALAARLDLNKVLQGLLTAMERVNPRWSEQLQQAEQQLSGTLGVKVRDDLLAALGDTWTLHSAPEEGGLLAGWTLTVSLKDAARFEDVHTQLVGFARGVFAQQRRAPRITTSEFADHRMFSLSVPEPEFLVMPTWCIVGDRLVITPLPQTMKAFLSRAADAPSLADHPDVAALLGGEGVPLALTYQDTRAQVEMFYPLLQYLALAASKQLMRQEIEVDPSALPSLAAILPHLGPNATVVRQTDQGFESTSRGTYPGASIGASAPILVALALPAVQAARAAARRAQAMKNLKYIGLAMHNYADVHKCLPPAYSTDHEGKPLLSWRVLILPYLEQQALYDQFHLDEPWDSPHNKPLAEIIPSVYHSPASQAPPGQTVYLGNATADGIFVKPRAVEGSRLPMGTRFRDIRDGTSNTIAVVEASDAKAVIWTKPDDFDPGTGNPLSGLIGLHPGGFNVLMCDGSVRFITLSIDKQIFKALLTRDGGEAIGSF